MVLCGDDFRVPLFLVSPRGSIPKSPPVTECVPQTKLVVLPILLFPLDSSPTLPQRNLSTSLLTASTVTGAVIGDW
jgi:hypothetical protein